MDSSTPPRWQLIVPVVSGVFALLGVVLGSELTRRSNERLGREQRMRDLRLQSVVKLEGAIIEWQQAIVDTGFARADYFYYRAAYQINDDKFVWDRATRADTAVGEQIRYASALRRDLRSSLAEIRIAFDFTPEREKLFDACRLAKTASIDPPRLSGASSLKELDEWYLRSTSKVREDVLADLAPCHSLVDELVQVTRADVRP